MSTVWSGWRGGLAVGINATVSPSTVTSSTSSATITWTIYARNMDNYSTGSYSWSTSGARTASGSDTGPYPADGRTWTVTSFTTTLATSYSGSVSASLTAALSWPYNGAAPSVSRTVTVGTRPPAAPSPASSVSAVVSGSNVAVSWVRPSNASSAGTIWSNVIVQRQVDSYSTDGWVQVAKLSGSATSWTDSGVGSNHQYFYRVYATNVSGSSATVTNSQGWVPTSPAAPTGLVAKRSGSNIKLTWTDQSPFNSSWTVQDSSDNGSTWSTVATGVGDAVGSAESWTHTSPSTSVTHTYRVAAVVNSFTVYSAKSNTVTLISPPSAPSNLGPAVVATGSTVSFAWLHNPTDTSDQTAFELTYSVDGGATWTDTGQVTSTDSTWDATAVCAAAGSVQWQVKTWGASPTAGPYSAIFTTTVSSTPTVTITNPGSSVDLSSVEVDWTYGQAEGSVQAAWSVQVVPQGGGDPVASGSGSDASSSWTTGTVLADATTYTAIASVTSAAGLSATATQDFAVAYDAPVAPTVTLDDQVANGYIGVTVATTSNGTDPDAVSIILERSIDGGEWQQLFADAVTSVVWLDYGCSLTGANSYRATAVSALPSQSQTTVTYQSPVLPRRNVLILATGDGLSDVLRFSLVGQADLTVDRDLTLNVFAGRAYPVPTHGTAVTRSIAVQATLIYPGDADSLEAQQDTIERLFVGSDPLATMYPTLYRDSLGRRFYCSLSALTVPSKYMPDASFTVTQVDPGAGVAEGVTA